MASKAERRVIDDVIESLKDEVLFALRHDRSRLKAATARLNAARLRKATDGAMSVKDCLMYYGITGGKS